MASPSDISLEQRFAVAKAYLDDSIPLRTIAELSGLHQSVVAQVAKEVLGDKYFVSRYKK